MDSTVEDEDGPRSSPERTWTFSHLPTERHECSGEAGLPGEEIVLENEREEAEEFAHKGMRWRGRPELQWLLLL